MLSTNLNENRKAQRKLVISFGINMMFNHHHWFTIRCKCLPARQQYNDPAHRIEKQGNYNEWTCENHERW